jgi:cellulose synthase/poly-beta-1,6-N-acetylglucosamine synthase-like glycosyltransferase
MSEIYLQCLLWFEKGILVYLFSINSIYFVLLVIGFFELLRHRYVRRDARDTAALEVSTLVPPISILAPAMNEAATIRESVRAMLMLRYPEFEVIVINDGSKDETLQLLIEEFHLYKSARYYDETLKTHPIRAVYESMDPIRLVVVDKEHGGKADSLNAGLNVARYPLTCAVDSDSVLEQDALLQVGRPFVEDPSRVIAVGGIVRIANGCQISKGQVERVSLPSSWIARFQVVEYLRAFLGGRVAFSSFNCLLVISGAFGVFLKSAVFAVGGYKTDTVGEDMELIVRLHHWARKLKRDYRIVFQPEPVCWTEVPESLRILKRQRNRWHRGTVETVWAHKTMIGRAHYGLLGLFAFPYFVLFEMLGPIVELTGYGLTTIGLLLGVLDWRIGLLFFLVSVLYGMILSTASVVLEELTMRRYPSVRHLVTLIVAGALENFGFRQLLTVWKAQAFLDVFRGNRSWGVMERKGFQKSPTQRGA